MHRVKKPKSGSTDEDTPSNFQLRQQVQALSAEDGVAFRIVVMNSGGAAKHHEEYEHLKDMEGNATEDAIPVMFFDNPFIDFQPSPQDELPRHLSSNKVASQIYNQSWHVMSGLATSHALLGEVKKLRQRSHSSLGRNGSSPRTDKPRHDAPSEYIMILEDDMEICSGALPVALADIRDAKKEGGVFRALLLSYGLNGN